MIDEKSIKLAADAAKELGLDKLAPAVYEDLVQPAAKETGKNLLVVAKGLGMAISPLKFAVWSYEQASSHLLRLVNSKLANKPAEEIKAPDPVVAGPVMLGMAFTSEAPHLREMYANLLATAMHSPSASKAHPSFATAIQQLSPAEAVILQKIVTYMPEFTIELDEVIGGQYTQEQWAQIRDVSLQTSWRSFCKSSGISDPALADTYRDNLMRLGILSYRYDVVADVLSGITGLKAARALKLADYGKHFLEVCVQGV